MRKVLLLMGSDSDLEAMLPALRALRDLGIPCDARVLSVHRAPALALEAAETARARGYGVVIAAAGMAAHLAGAVAAKTTLPVIGVPLASGPLAGVDALYSTVQMPPGVPVAAVAIGGARNAAILAAEILALADEPLAARLEELKEELAREVQERDARVRARLEEEGIA